MTQTCQRRGIPLVLLKTRSQPDDNYEDYFSSPETNSPSPLSGEEQLFYPIFIPVLEHQLNEEALNQIGALLATNQLKTRYGGMIFTSQRAVEGWTDIVQKVERKASSQHDNNDDNNTINVFKPKPNNEAIDTRSNEPFTTDIEETTPFPLYTVGPATARALDTLLKQMQNQQHQPTFSSSSCSGVSSLVYRLNPVIKGEHTGNGANLARFIQQDYNKTQTVKEFTYYEAPRLPFIPLLGMGSENYSRKRLEATDPQLAKKPLLFLVGEQRRDIIPRTLTDTTLAETKRIQVDEVEVYSTTVRNSFRSDFESLIQCNFQQKRQQQQQQQRDSFENPEIVVVVIFSPQGALEMLEAIGFLRDEGNSGNNNKNNDEEVKGRVVLCRDVIESRWADHSSAKTKYIVATIGPTTREFLVNKIGFEPDVVASSPSPAGVGDGVVRFLTEKGLL